MLNKLYGIMKDINLDSLLITDGFNMHHISGYKGHTGCMIITPTDKYILTDSRYTEQVTIEAPDFKCVDILPKGYARTVNDIIKADAAETRKTKGIRVGFENLEISYMNFKADSDVLGTEVEMVPLDDRIEYLRIIKTDDEIKKAAMAGAIGDKAFDHIIKFIQAGMTEKEIALELEYTMKKEGANALAFDTIAASGPNGSLPHAVPSDRRVENGDLLTMDFGSSYEGYSSDMTRTVFVGEEISDKQKEIYSIVYKAQTESLELVKPGAVCSDIDKHARDIITSAGYGEYFGHSLGHGVGLYVHEEPRLSRTCKTVLEPGMIVTVEPGIYIPGQFGVRIEDMVVVTETGYRNLTNSPKNLFLLA